jgi:agmatinase
MQTTPEAIHSSSTEKDQHERYVKSPFVKLALSARRENTLECSNLITGRKFQLNAGVKSVIDFLKHPKTFNEIREKFGMSGPTLEKALNDLRSSGIIVAEDDVLNETISFSLPGQRVFGVEEYVRGKASREIVFAGIPFGGGNSVSDGSKKFPDQLRSYSNTTNIFLSQKPEQIDYNFLGAPVDYGNLKEILDDGKLRDAGNMFIHFYEERRFVYEKIKTLADSLFSSKVIPFFLGGDHSVSRPLIESCSRHHPGLYIIHFDAHTDTYFSPFDSILRAGNIHHHGNFMTNLLERDEIAGVVQFGIRGVINTRIHAMEKQRIVWAHEVKKMLRGVAPFPEIPAGAPCYLTFDIDFLDPTIAPGTATPVPGGFTMEETKQLFAQALKGVHIVGADLVEVNPEKDRDSQTLQTATEIIIEILNLIDVKTKSS